MPLSADGFWRLQPELLYSAKGSERRFNLGTFLLGIVVGIAQAVAGFLLELLRTATRTSRRLRARTVSWGWQRGRLRWSLSSYAQSARFGLRVGVTSAALGGRFLAAAARAAVLRQGFGAPL